MEIAIDTEGGRVNALCALPSAYVSSPSAILLGSQNGSCSVWQTRTVAARAEDGRAQASGRLADAAPGPSFALDKLSSIFVSRSPVRCLDIASFDGTLLGVAGADDATITLLKLTSGSGFDAEIASSTPEIIQRVSVPASAAPTALCVDSVNELIMSGDARGGIALYNLRHMTAAPFYAGTLEGGSGPNILDAIFWTYSPQSFIVAASTNVYLVDARVAPDAACGLIALSVKIPSPSGSTVVSVDVFADDPWLVVYGSEDGSLGVADMRRPTVPWAFTQAHNGPVWGVCPVDNSPFIVAAGGDGVASLWNLDRFTSDESSAHPPTLSKHSSILNTALPLNCCDVDASGKVFCGDECGMLHVADLAHSLSKTADLSSPLD